MHTTAGVSPNASRKLLNQPIETPVGDMAVAKTIQSDDNRDPTIWFWVATFVVFILWGWWQHRNEKIRKELEPSNITANLHNIAIVTFAAVIGIVGGKVFFTKLAAIFGRIPVVGRILGYLAKLFGAA